MSDTVLPPESAGTAATSETDFDSYTREELASIVASGGVLPERKAAEAEAEEVTGDADTAGDKVADKTEDEKAATIADATDKADTEAAKTEDKTEEEKAKEATPDDLEAKVAAFKFTENADVDTRAKEEAEYLELVDLPEPVQAMIAARDTRLAELEAKVADAPETDQFTHQVTDAFNTLASKFKQDEDGAWVPDTTPLRDVLHQFFPKEYTQVVEDIMSEPSPKYNGMTRLQEFVRDGFNLNGESMQTLNAFLENGGKMPVPSFVPQGIAKEVAEAYWNSFDRDEIDEKVRRAVYALSDERSTDDEKQTAQTDLDRLNRQLGSIQKGIDAENQTKQAEKTKQQGFYNEVAEAGARSYIDTTLGLLDQGAEELAKSLTMFDPSAARMTATAYSVLVNSALSDVDEYAKVAQQKLAAEGIKLDWAAAGTTINKLWNTEQRVAGLQKTPGMNPRAIELAQRDKKEVLLELKSFEKSLIGQITASLAKGAGSALSKRIEDAKKLTVVRPKVRGAASAQGGKLNFDDMPLADLRDITSGRKPIPSIDAM